MWRLLFPPAESDSEVRDELAHQSRVGLTTLALIGAILAVAGLINSVISLTTSRGVFPSDAAGVALQNQTTVLTACLLLLALRRRSLALGITRGAAMALVLLFGTLLMRPQILGRFVTVPAAVGFVYVLALALMPFRPMMALALGAALTAVFGLAAGQIDAALGLTRALPAFLNAMVAGTILTGLLYQFRRRSAERQVEASHYRQKLEQTNRELQETRLQLVQSEKMASLGNLAAGVAHEINTPVGAIKASGEVTARALSRLEHAVEAGDTEAAQKPLHALRSTTEVTREATGRIVNIVRSLRSFARLDEAEEAWTDLNACVRDTVPLLRHEVKDDVELVLELGEIPKILCHPNQINQVVMNVVLNALQAMGRSGRVVIGPRAEDDGVALIVTDEGSGIAPEHLGRIFDPGFTTKGVGVGTGLGLSITYRIVHAHGGKIDVDSEPHVGTTVRVSLPRNPPASAPAPASL
jgi:two-component system NtrC family sensor kinase